MKRYIWFGKIYKNKAQDNRFLYIPQDLDIASGSYLIELRLKSPSECACSEVSDE